MKMGEVWAFDEDELFIIREAILIMREKVWERDDEIYNRVNDLAVRLGLSDWGRN